MEKQVVERFEVGVASTGGGKTPTGTNKTRSSPSKPTTSSAASRLQRRLLVTGS